MFNLTKQPRTAIYTDNNTNAWYIESLSTGDITVIQTKKNRLTMIISCYLDINLIDIIPKVLEKAVQFAKDNGLALIIGMD